MAAVNRPPDARHAERRRGHGSRPLAVNDSDIGGRLSERLYEFEKTKWQPGLAVDGYLPVRDARGLAVLSDLPSATVDHPCLHATGRGGEMVHDKDRTAPGSVVVNDVADLWQAHDSATGSAQAHRGPAELPGSNRRR